MMEIKKFGRVLALGAVLGSLAGCDNLLDVSDPSAFTDGDLDQALKAVAVGVEGELHANVDNIIIGNAILSDVWQHTGTWSGYDDMDHGRTEWERNSNSGSGLLRVRFSADDANARFDRLAAEGESIPSDCDPRCW